MNNKKLCMLCEEGYLTVHSEFIDVQQEGLTFLITSVFSICDSCESEVTDLEQSNLNVGHMILLKKRVNKLKQFIQTYQDRK